MTKNRELFDEVTEGFNALEAQRRPGKRTLQKREVNTNAAPKIAARELTKDRGRRR